MHGLPCICWLVWACTSIRIVIFHITWLGINDAVSVILLHAVLKKRFLICLVYVFQNCPELTQPFPAGSSLASLPWCFVCTDMPSSLSFSIGNFQIHMPWQWHLSWIGWPWVSSGGSLAFYIITKINSPTNHLACSLSAHLFVFCLLLISRLIQFAIGINEKPAIFTTMGSQFIFLLRYHFKTNNLCHFLQSLWGNY